VYIDVHKAIRRLTPAPKARVQRRLSEDPHGKHNDLTRCESDSAILDVHKAAATASFDTPVLSSSPKTATLMLRRSSAGLDGQFVRTTVPVRANFDDIRQHLKHLGPSNPATNPNKTRSTTVKVKPGSGVHSAHPRSASVAEPANEDMAMEEGDETTSLLKPQMSGKDGIQALSQTYGSVSPAITVQLAPQSNGVPTMRLDTEDLANKSTQTSARSSQVNLASAEAVTPTQQQQQQQQQSPQQASPPQQQQQQQLRTRSSGESTNSGKTENTLVAKRPYVRSGSITENVVESRGVRKVVLQTTGSNTDDESASAVAASLPEQPRLLGRTTFGLFTRDSNKEPASKEKENGKSQVEDVEEEEEEEEEDGDLMSPVPGDEEAPESYAEAAAKGAAVAAASQEAPAGPSAGGSAGGGGGAGKKKNRRKKRKGGKS